MSTESDPKLPHGIALAWGIAERPERGPKRELSVERIVEAAITIANDDGLDAVSMSKVASSLGFTTMSLYRYVSAKEDLITLMEEAGIGLAPRTTVPGSTWRTGLELMTQELFEMYQRHSWLLDIPITQAPMTPNNLSWLDWGLHELESTGLSYGEKVNVITLLSGFSKWEATLARNFRRSQERRGTEDAQNDEAYESILLTLVTPERYPDLAVALQDAAFTTPNPGGENDFEFSRSRILDGIAQYIKEKKVAESSDSPDESPIDTSKITNHESDGNFSPPLRDERYERTLADAAAAAFQKAKQDLKAAEKHHIAMKARVKAAAKAAKKTDTSTSQ